MIEINKNNGILKDLERLKLGLLKVILILIYNAENRDKELPNGSLKIALPNRNNPLE